jgi:hypothetical protein
LQERAVIVDLVLHLAVGAIESAVEQGETKSVSERLAGVDIVGHLRTAGVAARADLRFGDLSGGRRRHRRSFRRIAAPGDGSLRPERRRQAAPRVAGRFAACAQAT